MITARRSFLLGATAFLAAPSIVRAASLMTVSVIEQPFTATMLNAANAKARAAEQRIADWIEGSWDDYQAAMLRHYAAPYAFTDKTIALYEDDLPVTRDVLCHSPRDRHEAA